MSLISSFRHKYHECIRHRLLNKAVTFKNKAEHHLNLAKKIKEHLMNKKDKSCVQLNHCEGAKFGDHALHNGSVTKRNEQ